MRQPGGSGRSKYSLAPLPSTYVNPYENLNTIDQVHSERTNLAGYESSLRADPASVSAKKYKAYLGPRSGSSRTKLPALHSNGGSTTSLGHIRKSSRDFKKENIQALKNLSTSMTKERAGYVSSKQIRSMAKQAPDLQASRDSFASVKRAESKRLATLVMPNLNEIERNSLVPRRGS